MIHLSNNQKKQIANAGAALLVGYITKTALTALWRGFAKKAPPAKPSSPEVPWKDAIAWTLVSTAAVSLASLAANRLVEEWMDEEA